MDAYTKKRSFVEAAPTRVYRRKLIVKRAERKLPVELQNMIINYFSGQQRRNVSKAFAKRRYIRTKRYKKRTQQFVA